MSSEQLRLGICWPWSLETTPTRFTESVLNLRCPPDCEVQWLRGLGDTAARRHIHCMEQALAHKVDVILILGTDQVYHDRDMLVKLIGHYRNGYDCLTALVPMRGVTPSQGTKPFQLIGFRRKPDKDGNVVFDGDMRAELYEPITRADGPLVQCHAVGSGVLMFPTAALNKVEQPWFKEERHPITMARLTCSDTNFVGRLLMTGYELWCDTTIKVTHLQTFEIDDSFPERFADWGTGANGDASLMESRPTASLERIYQARVSPAIPFYQERFHSRYGFLRYCDPEAPAIFFGLYGPQDYEALAYHTGPAIVVWAGSDASAMRPNYGYPVCEVLLRPNVYHVAISKFIAEDLDAVTIPYVQVPFCNVDESKFSPCPRGKKVYAYCPDHDRDKYGGVMLDRVIEAMPDVEFHVQRTLDPNADMQAIYSDCFIGLRLLEHDGLSNTVVELGLMGRRCLWNGDTPNSIQYSDVDGIVAGIRHEMAARDDNEHVGSEMSQYIHPRNEWKSTSFYEPSSARTVTLEIASEPFDANKYFQYRYKRGEYGAGGPHPCSTEAKWTRNTVLALLNEHKAYTVTEVGCGSLARWESPPRTGYIGIDVSETAIAYAKQKFNDYPDAKFMVKDVTKETIPTADAVLCIDVLQHIKPDDVEGVLQKMLAAARKVLIVKTSVGIPELHYQFNHDWEKLAVAEHVTMEVPGVPVSRVFVFAKEKVCQPQQ